MTSPRLCNGLIPVPLSAPLFRGHIGLEVTRRGVQPWRIRLADRALHHPALLFPAGMPSGVRLVFQSDASELLLEVDPGEPRQAPQDQLWKFDLLIEGALVRRLLLPVGAGRVHFKDLPSQRQYRELFLPSGVAPVRLRKLAIPRGSHLEPVRDVRPRWVTYGSSITQCGGAAGPSETWPAIVARHFNLNFTSLGYGGQCHLDPLMGRMIRDLPADYISVCLGINVNGQSSLTVRTFGPAVIGLLQTLRDGHPHTPILVISPIFSLNRETVPNNAGLSLVMMRQIIAESVKKLQAAGARNLQYLDGLNLFGSTFDRFMPDHLHPNPEGYRRLAQRFIARTHSFFTEGESH